MNQLQHAIRGEKVKALRRLAASAIRSISHASHRPTVNLPRSCRRRPPGNRPERNAWIFAFTFCLTVTFVTRYSNLCCAPAPSQLHAGKSVGRRSRDSRLHSDRNAAQRMSPVESFFVPQSTAAGPHVTDAEHPRPALLFDWSPYNRPPPPSAFLR